MKERGRGKRRLRALLILLAALGLTACGSEPEGSVPKTETVQGGELDGGQAEAAYAGEGEEQVGESEDIQENSGITSKKADLPKVDRAGNPISLPEETESIVSLAPATTQVLCDLGLGGRLVAVDTNSPQYAEGLPEDVLQMDMMAPDMERLAALRPSVVFASSMSSQGGEDVFKPLRDAGICVAEIPTPDTLEGVKEDVQFIADCVGRHEQGKELVDGMQREIDQVAAIGAKIGERKTVLFEISPLPYLYSFGRGVYLDEILTLIGADNVLGDQEGWIAVTEESALAADPDVILTSDNFSSDDPVGEILGRKGWEEVNAVKNGEVYYIDNAASSLPNHHVAEALRQMAGAIYPDEYAGLR